MNKLTAIKLAAKIIVGAGTTNVTNSIIRNNVAPTNLFQQISVGVTAVVIGSMASHATIDHATTKIDELAADWNKAKAESKEESTDPA
jgi:hypothetical protein